MASDMTERKRASFIADLEWRICRHRRVRQRPLPHLESEMPHEEYCDLSADVHDAISQYCRRDSCPFLGRQDVP